MFHLRVFNFGIHIKCNFNHYLLLFVIFHDVEIKRYLSNVLIKILILGNISDRSIAIVSGTVFLNTFQSLWKLAF